MWACLSTNWILMCLLFCSSHLPPALICPPFHCLRSYPLCNCLLFWRLLIAEMLILHTDPGHPPAEGRAWHVWRITATEFLAERCGENYHQVAFELLSYSISNHRLLLWLHCEDSSSLSSSDTDRWENTKMIWLCSVNQGQKAKKVVNGEFTDSHLWGRRKRDEIREEAISKVNALKFEMVWWKLSEAMEYMTVIS